MPDTPAPSVTTDIDLEQLIARLGGSDDIRDWMTLLAAQGEPAEPITLPEGDSLVEAALRLTVPHADLNELLAVRRQVEQDDELWWLLRRGAAAQTATIGQVGRQVRAPTPTLPESLGALGRYFYVLMFMAVLPAIRAYHHGRGIPDEISWRTLTDMGRHMTTHRWKHGTGGLNHPFWQVLHYSGQIYQLGRLQFDRGRVGTRTGEAFAAAGLPYRKEDPALGVHIPAWSGPFDPASCDDSFRQATAFYRRHYPETDYRIAVCHSWLLDPALAEYLPASSNIVRFQRRFRLLYRPDDDGGSTLQFVFGHSDRPLDDYPQTSTLERAVVAHLRAGHAWRGGMGWLEL